MSAEQAKRWIPQGQWATEKGTAECVEEEGWGIIGAWIDQSNEPEENFRLILAAPELLEACRLLLRLAERVCGKSGVFRPGEREAVAAAKAAISKAELQP